ncbi:MAG: BT4734/BF3469 family protein [Bacteroidota bacterium]
MINPQDITISKFRFTTSKENVLVSLLEELNSIKLGTYKSLIDACRAELDDDNKANYDRLKSELPCVTFCATFIGTHGINNIQTYNNLLIFDIDKIDQDRIDYLSQVLKMDKYIFSFWISPSGRGIKGLIRISNEIGYHKQVFYYFRKYFRDNYDTELDSSGSNVNRPCYVSYDKNIHINLNCDVFTLEDKLISKASNIAKKAKNNSLGKIEITNSKSLLLSFGLNKMNNRIMIQRIISFLKKNNLSITASHEQWYKCAYAISKTFSYDVGKKYFRELCLLDGVKFDEEASEDKLKYCYEHKDKDNGSSFASIIYYAEQVGFINFDKIRTKRKH